jgi:hypothetical protein
MRDRFCNHCPAGGPAFIRSRPHSPEPARTKPAPAAFLDSANAYLAGRTSSQMIGPIRTHRPSVRPSILPPSDLEELDWIIEPHESDDGVLYGYNVYFSESSDRCRHCLGLLALLPLFQ